MSAERPWIKDFNNLIENIAGSISGEITRPDKNADWRAIGNCPWDELYPTIKGVYKGKTIHLEIREVPAGIGTAFHVDDNVEYLRVSIMGISDFAILVTNETWFDKFKRKIGLEYEFQTGNLEYDDKFWIDVDGDHSKELISRPKIQSTIIDLEPFSALQISKGRILHSQAIKNKDQLDCNKTISLIDKLYKFSQLIQN